MKPIFYLLAVLTLSLSVLNAQKKPSPKPANETNWQLGGFKFRSLGPAMASGRIADMAVDPREPNTFYLAVASGGVWKTENNATTWSPIFDQEGSYSIGCVAVHPSNPNQIWVGTGENNNQRSVAYGDGVYRSDDAGKTWKNMGLKQSEHIGMFAFDAEQPEMVMVAAYGPLWSAGGDRGVYRSRDAGKNWERVLYVSEHTGINEVHRHPSQKGLYFATAHQRRRHVFTYLGGGPESALYRSTDHGSSWEKVENGLPTGDVGRMSLAISPANPDVMHLLVEGHGTYQSTDRGASWQKQSGHSTAGNYYAELVPHPTQAFTLYSLDTYCQVSHDGGKTFSNLPEENKHVDNHCLWINPKNPQHMRMGCDGGFYQTYDGAKTWFFSANLPITQFYRVSTDNALPFYNIYGGTQDNFSLKGPSRTRSEHGIANSDWVVTNTGDGFETQVDPENPNIVYAQAQYGYLVRYDGITGESLMIKPQEPANGPAWRWNWDAPLLISPHNPKRLYFCANVVFKSNDRGQSWETISSDLSKLTDRNSLKVMDAYWPSSAIAKNQSTSIYGNIVAFNESPLVEDFLFAGTDDGLIHIKTAGQSNWTRFESFPGIPVGTYVQGLWPSTHQANTVYAAFNNHKNGDFKPYLMVSRDAGKSWQSISANLPERGSVYAFAEDHLNPNLLFAGTEFGLFVSLDGGLKWQALKAGLPTIAVKDIAIQKRENDLILATFGRGFYVLDDYSALRVLAQNGPKPMLASPQNVKVFLPSSPLGYSGSGFQGAGYYLSANPPIGVNFTYYVPEVPKTLKAEREAQEAEKRKAKALIPYPSADQLKQEALETEPYLLLSIADENQIEINRLVSNASAGSGRWHWDATYPSAAGAGGQKAQAKPQRTSLVKPGNYTATLQLISRNGAQTIGKTTFALSHLEGAVLPAGNLPELVEFQRLADAERSKLRQLGERLESLKKEVAFIEKNLLLMPGMPTDEWPNVQQLHVAFDQLNELLNGNSRLAKLEAETLPGLEERIGNVCWSVYSSSSAPTQTHREQLQIVRDGNNRFESLLNETTQNAKRLYDRLLAYQLPELSGSLQSR